MKRLVIAGLLFATVAYAGLPIVKSINFKTHGASVGNILDDCLKCHNHDKYKRFELDKCYLCHISSVPPNAPSNIRVE